MLPNSLYFPSPSVSKENFFFVAENIATYVLFFVLLLPLLAYSTVQFLPWLVSIIGSKKNFCCRDFVHGCTKTEGLVFDVLYILLFAKSLAGSCQQNWLLVSKGTIWMIGDNPRLRCSMAFITHCWFVADSSYAIKFRTNPFCCFISVEKVKHLLFLLLQMCKPFLVHCSYSSVRDSQGNIRRTDPRYWLLPSLLLRSVATRQAFW